jgi:hypothetical protein
MAALLGLLFGSAAYGEGLTIRFGADVKAVHIPVGPGRAVRIVPAFEDYAIMLEDACKAMELRGKDCLIYPMNGEIGRNAIAAVHSDGTRMIVYGRELSPDIGYDGALGVMAHELGHHYCGHIGKRGDAHTMELAADQFAGAVLRKMSRSLKNTLSMAAALDERASPSHPNRAERIVALRSGWERPERAKGCVYNRQ